MGSVGTVTTEAVMRQDISKLTKAQQNVMQTAYNDVELARTHTLLEWALNERYQGVSSEADLDEYRIVKNYEDFHYKSAEEAKESMLKTAQEYADEYGEYYRLARDGIVLTNVSSHTLNALEKRGYIEVIYDGGLYVDRIKIIERR